MTNCKDCTTNCVYRGKDNEARCGSFVGTVTNADRIRSMSDEDLANLLTDYSNNSGWVTEIGRKICFERIYEWLKQPFEGE